MAARIYSPARSAMTSGTGNTGAWVLEFEPGERKAIDPLMGWTGSGDMNGQVKLRFDTRDAAIDYAKRHGLAYRVEEPKRRAKNIRPMGYASNFAHNRRVAWSH
ncbi:MAG: ETC complex I subunit [Pseudomonadota bacterium]